MLNLDLRPLSNPNRKLSITRRPKKVSPPVETTEETIEEAREVVREAVREAALANQALILPIKVEKSVTMISVAPVIMKTRTRTHGSTSSTISNVRSSTVLL